MTMRPNVACTSQTLDKARLLAHYTLHERVAAEQALGGQLMDGGREQQRGVLELLDRVDVLVRVRVRVRAS